MTTSVLIVEDEPSILELISYTCRTSGMEVRKAANVAEAKKNLEAAKPDIILLDWMLPDCAGLEWLYELRRYHSNESLPVIMLTAKGEDMDKILGLEYGADDYITKPFNILEVKARMKAIMRRVAKKDGMSASGKVVVKGDLKIDCESRRVFSGDRELNLTAKEFDLLELLAMNPNKVYSRESLLNIVWGYEYPGDARTVDVHIRRLREKIEVNPSDPKYVYTKWGVGYYFRG